MRTVICVLLVSTPSLHQVLSVPTDPPRRRYQLVEEEPVGTFVADVKTDSQLSVDELSFVVLTPEGELGHRLFSIEKTTGVLRTATVVDRDVICPGEVDCLVDVDVGVQPRRYFQVLKLSVEILDLNDHSPRYPSSRVELEVSEATVPGVLFHINPAEDADGPGFGISRYELTSSSEHFDVQLPDPDVPFESPLLILLEPLDREDQDLHQLKIVAYDGGNPTRSGSVLVDVVVVDINDNTPQFTQNTYRVDILENSAPSSSLLAVSADDPDLGPNADVIYAFSRQSEAVASSMFELNPTTGVLSSLGSLDYESTGSSLAFDVIASNPVDGVSAIQTATARVTVNVVDVNDNAPVLRVDAAITGSSSTGSATADVVSVQENCPPDSVVAHLSVTDPDTGLGGQVDCTLAGNSAQFRLVHIFDAEFQLLTSSTASLDRETAESFRLVITCHDNGDPPMTSSVELDVEVEDVDDNIPQFSRAVYNFAVDETTAPGSTLGRVSATDADSAAGLRSTLRYYIHEDAEDRVSVDAETGEIVSTSELDHESASFIRFHVLASDNSDAGRDETRTASALVIVAVLNVDDEPPVFEQRHYELSVPENQPAMTLVGHVVARDADAPPYDELQYHLNGGMDADAFVLDPKTGSLRTRKMLDRERKSVYHVTVMAESTGRDSASRRTFANITIRVGDLNDHAPIVISPSGGNGSVHVSSSAPIHQPVARVQAVDTDIGPNGRLTYEWTPEPGSTSPPFQVERQTGGVYVTAPLNDVPDGTTYRLSVIVRDNGTPPTASTANLYLVVDRDVLGAERSRSRATTVTDRGEEKFRFVLEGKLQLGLVIGVIVLCIILAGALLAAIVVCRRRRTRCPPDGATSDGKQGEHNGAGGAQPSSGETTADVDDSVEIPDQTPGKMKPKPLAAIVTMSKNDRLQTEIAEHSPSWYTDGKCQWQPPPAGRSPVQGCVFHYDTNPIRRDAGRCSGIGEMRKPAAYSVTEQSFPAVIAASSPSHHIDIHQMATHPGKVPYPLSSRATIQSSPSAAGSLRSTGRVRFLDGRLVGSVGPGGESTVVPGHRLAPDLCDPGSADDVACMAGSSLTAPPSILRARCLRGQTQQHAYHSNVDDLPPPTVTTGALPPDHLLSKYSHN